MMNCFPILYEDELFYSIISRYRRMCGITSGKALMKDLFGYQVTLSSAYFPTHLKDLVTNLPYSSKINEEIILADHTLYTFFTSFVSDSGTKDIFESVKKSKGSRVILKMGMADNDVAMGKHLRFCPECFKEDIDIRGESYWRRLHQIPGVLFCIKHGCSLLNSKVLAANSRIEQECADEDTCLLQRHSIKLEDRLKRLNLEMSNQAYYLLNTEFLRKDLSFIVDFYVDRLRELKLASASGNIYMKELQREFIDFYSQDYLEIMQVAIDTEKNTNWLRTFVRNNNKNRNPIKHLLLLQFLGVEAKDLFNYSKVVGRLNVVIDHKPLSSKVEMRSRWLKIIKENPEASRTDLKTKGKGTYTWMYRHDRDFLKQTLPPLRTKKGQSSFVNWEKRDSEYLKMSEKAVEEIMKYKGKPIRICKATIRRHLGLNTWFNNKKLVKTHEFISKSEENITNFRIRKIKWSISEMIVAEISITPYKVQLYAGFGGGTTEVRQLIEKELFNIQYNRGFYQNNVE